MITAQLITGADKESLVVDYSPCIWTWGRKAPENKGGYTCFGKERVPVCIQGRRQKCLLRYLWTMIVDG